MKKQAPGEKRNLLWIRLATWWMQLERQSAQTPAGATQRDERRERQQSHECD
jgi:hypothetical protein